MDTKLQKNVQQYIQLVYSSKSPFSQVISLDERKRAACKKVGFDYQDEKIKQIIDLHDEKVRDMVIEYLWTNETHEVMNLMSDSHIYLQIQELKMTPLTISDDEEKMLKAMNLKTTMSQKAKELMENMNAAYLKIFKGPAEINAAKKKVNWITLEQRIKDRDEKRKKEATQIQQ